VTLPAPSALDTLARSRLLLACVLLAALLLVGTAAIRFQAPGLLGAAKILTDFDAFHIAGTLAGRGEIDAAYDAARMMDAQAEIASVRSFMPYTYPPPFTLIADALARLPIGSAYALFALASFGLYLAVLRRIAGEGLLLVLLALIPTIMLNLRTGQTGFLVAGLVGAFLLAWRDNRALAGLPLGLLVIKPHLAVGAGLLALSGRRWDVVAIAAAVVAAAAGLATIVYGMAVWTSFLGAVREAGTFLAGGHYPMYRMSSAYAFFLTIGVPAPAALTAHFALAAVAASLLIWTALARIAFRHRAALVCVLSLFVSPYNYDYDLALIGIALAFILPDIAARASPPALAGLLALSWATGGYGMAINTWKVETSVSFESNAELAHLSATFPLLVVLCAAVIWLVRAPTGAEGGTAGTAPAMEAASRT
jgi:hypothetical protein